MIELEFFGVRGSTPCSCQSTAGFGGNTSCVLVRCGAEPPIILDLGTGLRYLGQRLVADGLTDGFRATALVSHLHWDHVQGLPFFLPLLQSGAALRMIGPEQPGSSLEAEIRAFVRPPLFPVDVDGFPGTIDCVELSNGEIEIGSATVTVRPVQHVGPTSGYRIDHAEASVAYVPDHQQPLDGDVPAPVLDLCRGVDVLIHDAQYDDQELVGKADWGHSSYGYAVEVARRADVDRLVLFHHDPAHDDDWIADAARAAQRLAGPGITVTAAAEGDVLRSGRVQRLAV